MILLNGQFILLNEVATIAETRIIVGGVDGTRTRDPRRDRPVF